jgi:IS30 family transposase
VFSGYFSHLFTARSIASSRWRRNKIQQLLVRGYSQWDIADELQIDQSTVSRDIQYLRHQAQESLKSHIQNKLPEEYQYCLTGMDQVLKLSRQAANNSNQNNNGNNT